METPLAGHSRLRFNSEQQRLKAKIVERLQENAKRTKAELDAATEAEKSAARLQYDLAVQALIDAIACERTVRSHLMPDHAWL